MNLRRMGWSVLLMVMGGLLLGGCGGEGGSDQNYDGTWTGRTSNGGRITFTVEGDWVRTLRLEDPTAQIWLPQPVDIRGSTFAAQYLTETDSSDAVRLQGTFTSATHLDGSYSLRKGSYSLSGTFTATRQ